MVFKTFLRGESLQLGTIENDSSGSDFMVMLIIKEKERERLRERGTHTQTGRVI